MRMLEVISSVVSDRPSRSAVRDLIALFHKFAIIYLRKKASSGSLNPGLFGIPLEDVAFDCITELFCRDARGAFVELQTYYINLNFSSLSDEELMAASRRLVFSKITRISIASTVNLTRDCTRSSVISRMQQRQTLPSPLKQEAV